MWKVTLKGLLGHKIRFALTAIAVTLGVAFMAGTLVLTDTIKVIFDDLVTSVTKGTDAYVRSRDVIDTAFGEQRDRVDAAVLGRVREIDGVREADGVLQFYAQVVGSDGRTIGNPMGGAPTLGLIWNPGSLTAWRLVEGRGPTENDEVVIDRASATTGRVAVGDTVSILSQQAPAKFRVSGIATFGNADSAAGATAALFTTPTAQFLSGAVGRYDGIQVAGEEGISQRELVARITAGLADPAVQVITGERLTKENQDAFAQQLQFFNVALLAFALIALFVGSFIIFNTFSIIVAQRTREIGLLRAMGASRRQITLSVLAEAVAVGLLASLAGLLAGIGLAVGLKALLGAVGIDIPNGATQILPRTVIVGLGLGTGITVVSALLPARRAAKIAPIEALRASTTSTTKRLVVRSIMGVLVTGAGVLALLFGLFGSGGVEAVGFGAFLIFLGVAVLLPVIARPVSRFIAWPLPRLRGTVGTLARENAARNPRRTASTAAALMIGVALVGFITIFASSIKASFASSIDQAFRSDYVIRTKGQGPPGLGGFSPALAREVAEVPGVEAAGGIRFAGADIEGRATFLGAADPTTATTLFDIEPRRGDLSRLGPAQIAVSTEKMRDEGWRLGQSLAIRFPKGPANLTIAATYGAGQRAGLFDFLISTEAYDIHYTERLDSQVFVKLEPDADRSVVTVRIQRVLRDYPNAELQDQEEFKASQTAQVDQVLNLIYALLALAVIIALIGIANTLGLSIIERTSELGLLRAVGMTKRQLRSVIRWEAVIIALLGTLLGMVIAGFLGWSLVHSLADQGLSTFRAPARELVVIMVFAAFAGVIAAILPARRAAKIDILDAISYE
jgi:putative ABC transport system permease protein